MRVWLCSFVALAVLVVSFEGAVSAADLEPLHEGQPQASLETSHSPAHDDSGRSTPDHGHCGHYCHGHLTNVGFPLVLRVPHVLASALSDAAVHAAWRPQAPPTPPPNA